MAALAPFLVLCAFVLGFHHVQATAETLSSLDSSFCHGGLEVIYPGLDVKQNLIVQEDLRKKVTTVWKAPQIYFPVADKLAERGSIAQAALREQRLDISLILIPSRVHTKSKKYILVMVDPDAPMWTNPTSAYWRHWLVVDIQGATLRNGNMQGTTLTDYRSPSPPQKSGFHRYQFMLFVQPPGTPVSLTEQEMSSRGKWDLQGFVDRFELKKPVACIQFRTQNYKD